MATKTCIECGQEYPATLDHFYAHKSARDRLYYKCKPCVLVERRAYYQANRQKVCERVKAYAATHKEERAANHRRWVAQNRARVRELNRLSYRRRGHTWKARRSAYYLKTKQRQRELTKLWAAAHPEKMRVWWERRRARLVQAEGKTTAQDVKRILADQGNRCFYCGAELGSGFHLDHKLPLVRGGTNYPDNLCAACPRCNLSKGTKTAEEFLAALEVQNG